MTFGYGRTDAPYGTADFPYHRGDDYYMPDGTPIIINGVQIGISGHTGFVTGPHCHVGRFVGGKDTNPNGQAWTLDDPRVTDISYDDINGNSVGLLDAGNVRWVFLHMWEKSTCVIVGQRLADLPKFKEEIEVSTADIDTVKRLAQNFFSPEQVAAMGGDDWLQANVGTETNSLIQAWANSPQNLQFKADRDNALALAKEKASDQVEAVAVKQVAAIKEIVNQVSQ